MRASNSAPRGASREDLGTARMKSRLLHILLAVGVVVVTMLTAFTIPASAEQRVIYVKLPTGQVVPVTVDVPAGHPDGPDRAPRHARAARHAVRAAAGGAGAGEASADHHLASAAHLPGRRAPAQHARRHAEEKAEGAQEAQAERRAPAGLGLDPRVKRRRRKRTATRCAGRTEPHAEQPRLRRRAAGPLDPQRGPELRDPQVPRPGLPAADLPGGGHPVRRPLGDPGRDQRDRDRLRPQPERLDARARSAGCSSSRSTGAPYGVDANKDGARTPTTRSTRSSPPPAI